MYQINLDYNPICHNAHDLSRCLYKDFIKWILWPKNVGLVFDAEDENWVQHND